MALVGIELETIVSEPDALTTRPPKIFTMPMQACFSSRKSRATSGL